MLIQKFALAAAISGVLALTPSIAEARGGGGGGGRGGGHGGGHSSGSAHFGGGFRGGSGGFGHLLPGGFTSYGYRTPYGRYYGNCAYVTAWGQCVPFMSGWRR